MEDVIEEVRALVALGVTQRAIAHAANVSPATVSLALSGQTGLHLDTARALAAAVKKLKESRSSAEQCDGGAPVSK